MKKESRDQLIQAYESLCSALGFSSLGAGLRYVCGELEKSLRVLKPVRTREALELSLIKTPEPSTTQLAAMVEALRLFPYTLRKALPDAARDAAKRLPHQPGGRPRKLKPDEHPRVCQAIGQLIAKGVRLRTAQQRIAQREGCSLRTIQRVWQKRGEIAKVKSFSNANDIL